MFDDLIRLIAENGIQRTQPILILAALRPFGLLFGFLAMGWAFGPARTLRVSIAVTLGIPVMIANIAEIEALVIEGDIRTLAFIAPKELLLGYAIGFLSSLPFFALQFAGAVTDSFRGESDSGLMSPIGEPLSTFGALYLVIGMAAFATFDGITILVENLYQSYVLWPLGGTVPTLSADAGVLAVEILTSVLWLTIQVATPLLIFLATIEFSISIAARLAKRFNFYDHAFALKNLGAILSLPFLATFIWLFSSGLFEDIEGGLRRLEVFFE